MQKLGLVHRLISSKNHPEILTPKDFEYQMRIYISVRNEASQIDFFRKTVDILEPTKNQFISIMINSGQFPKEFSKLEISGELQSAYIQFKKMIDEASNSELNHSDEEFHSHAATERSTTSVFKVNKENLEKDYNMVELLL